MSSTLGSVFEPEQGGPRGRDLTHKVCVPRSCFGAPVMVRVPMVLPIGAVRVPRSDPHGDGEAVTISIPVGVDQRVRLRMRGLGEARDSGRGGDLYLIVTPGTDDDLTDLIAPAAHSGGRGILTWVLWGLAALGTVGTLLLLR